LTKLSDWNLEFVVLSNEHRMNIGIDMMGGDYAPLEAVKGVQQYLTGNSSPANLLLIGDKTEIEKLLASHGISSDHIKVIHAEQVIDMHEHPNRALKEKQKSSIAIGFYAIRV